jgi:ABC-type multidrug transport system fused ATPase/permease subunit
MINHCNAYSSTSTSHNLYIVFYLYICILFICRSCVNYAHHRIGIHICIINTYRLSHPFFIIIITVLHSTFFGFAFYSCIHTSQVFITFLTQKRNLTKLIFHKFLDLSFSYYTSEILLLSH